MEEYNLQLSEKANSRGGGGGSFLYGGGSVLVPSSSMYAATSSGFLGDGYDEQGDGGRHHHAAAVKTETGTSANHHHRRRHEHDGIKAKIVGHPQYSNLLEAYMECQMVGAPPEVAARLTAVREEFEAGPLPRATAGDEKYSEDPELDQFMEAYYHMLMKYREELSRPLQEAMDFMRLVESQLNLSEHRSECIASSEDNIGGEIGVPEINPRAEDRELKSHLLQKYSGHLSSLKQELSKKKKKGKLSKEARHKLLNWWELHYKWPYPSESEKMALAESSGLDQKQINNWFINQRKRHWKPSEEMRFMVMDAPNAAFNMDRHHYLADGPYRLGP